MRFNNQHDAHRKHLGQWAETHAKQMLETQGYVCLAQNYHSRYGEIDLIMQQQACVVFIEVKARAQNSLVRANAVISSAKQMKIAKTALLFLQQHAHLQQYFCRFDVVCIDFQQSFAKTTQSDFSACLYDVQWIENAFTFDEELINL